MNVLVGHGDIGKTAILDALELALTPSVVQGADETDYSDLEVRKGFSIELLVGALSDEVKASLFMPPLWGWDSAKRELHGRPSPETDDEPVLRILVSGTPDLEVVHELLSPGAANRRLSVQDRIVLAMWSVGVGRSPESELRMRRGALLERALRGDKLRGTAVQAFRGLTNDFSLPEESDAALKRVGASLKAAGVPTDGLGLGIVSSRGQSPVATFGLVVSHGGEAKMPMGSFGRGTQQLAMVSLAAARASDGAIAIADELETGLEPYRQRQVFGLLRGVTGASGQAFVTTHSPTVLACASAGEIWRVVQIEGCPRPMPVDGGRVPKLLTEDPSAFFARLIIVGEGVTEVGFVERLLGSAAATIGQDLFGLGVHVADGGGHETSLVLIEELHSSGHTVMGFVDNEVSHSGTRQRLIDKGIRMHIDPDSRNLEHSVVLALPDLAAVDALLAWPAKEDPTDFPGRRAQQVGERMGRPGKLTPSELAAAGEDPAAVREAVAAAAHKRGWFKSREGGASLGRFVQSHVPSNSPLLQRVDTFWRHVQDHIEP